MFDAIAERAERLCEGGSAVVYLREGDALKRVATHGPMVWQAPALTLPLNRDSTAGRAVLEARTIHIEDVYAAKDVIRRRGSSLKNSAPAPAFPSTTRCSRCRC